MPFANKVNITQAPAVEGDIASLNPRHLLPGAAGAWVAGVGGVTMGRFAWGDLTASDSILVNNGSGVPTCIVGREFGTAVFAGPGIEASMTTAQGFPVDCPIIGGDIWVKNTNASAAAAINQKAFAKLTDGTVQFAAAGATVAGYVETKWVCATIGAAGEIVKITNVSLD